MNNHVLARRLAAAAVIVAGLAGCGASKAVSSPSTSTIPSSGPATTVAAASPGSTATSKAPSVTQPSSGPTTVRYVSPVDLYGHPTLAQAGPQNASSCEPGSDSIVGVEVYRCFSGNYVYDPCWDDSTDGRVVCMTSPWDASSERLIANGIPTGVDLQATTDLNHPWGVELTDGARCTALQGAHGNFGSAVINFGCTGGSIPGRSLLNEPSRTGSKWTFQTAITHGAEVTAGPIAVVDVAYFAGPAPISTKACSGQAITVTFDGGSGSDLLLFKNTSTTSCSLAGYPGVAAVDSSGNQALQVTRSASSGAANSPGAVVMPPGSQASALLQADLGSNGSCPTYQQMIVTPPNTTTSTELSVGGLAICPSALIDPVEPSGPTLK